MKVTIKGFVHLYSWGEYCVYTADVSSETCVLVGPVEFEYEVPDDFDPVKNQVATLEARIAEVEAEAKAKTSVLRDRIASLLCIENSAEVVE